MAKIQGSPKFRAVDTNTGAALAGGKLYTYLPGTATLKTTYTAQDGLTPNTNPVQLDGNGEADVWLGPGGYKFVLHDAYDVLIWSVDGLQIPDAETFASLVVTGAATLAAVTVSGQITSTVATGTAPLVISSTTKVVNLNADLLDGKQWDAPDPIGATTPNTGKFISLEDTGNLNVNGVTTLGSDLIQTSQGVRQIVQKSSNLAEWRRGELSEDVTLSLAGTTTDSVADLLPANAIIEAVVARVTQAITVATDWKLGDASTAARFLAAQSGAQLNLGATAVGLAHQQGGAITDATGPVQLTAAKLRITTTGTPGAGKIRITVLYRSFVPPAS